MVNRCSVRIFADNCRRRGTPRSTKSFTHAERIRLFALRLSYLIAISLTLSKMFKLVYTPVLSHNAFLFNTDTKKFKNGLPRKNGAVLK